ncbi:MAG: prenyltransferase/squalene oxidase repeat-containing protein, partial [Thermoguttaceae bacterium]
MKRQNGIGRERRIADGLRLCIVMALGTLVASRGLAAETENAAPRLGPDPKLYQTTVDRAIQFLGTRQTTEGALSPQLGIGPTALYTLGLLRAGRSPSDPQAAKGLAYLEEAVQENGGIYKGGGRIPNYETCIALVCLKEANRNGKYDKTIKDAERFLRDGQVDERKVKDKSDVSYGGMGYGGRTRPDLSNTAYLLDALKACGAGADDPAVKKALEFASRCQNLESEHNTTKYAAKVNDGGFFYTPSVSKQDPSRETPNGGLRSYGSMTYSGLKSMIYAGLKKDDPRVKAAIKWIGKNYDLKSNPGMGQAGLYYYYHTFAKALDAFGA